MNEAGKPYQKYVAPNDNYLALIRTIRAQIATITADAMRHAHGQPIDLERHRHNIASLHINLDGLAAHGKPS